MDILYLGSFFPETHKKKIISNSIGVIQNAGDTFQKGILSGLIQHNSCNEIITLPMIGSFPSRYRKIIFRGDKFLFDGKINSFSLSFINISLYKIFSRYKSVIKQLEDWASRNTNEKYIIVFSLDISLMRAASEIKLKHKNVRICIIVTDLLEYMVLPSTFFSKYIYDFLGKKTEKYLMLFDSFVLLTKYMRDKLNISDKPNIVIEGIYENTIDCEVCDKEKHKTILYSGTLAKVYGIEHLLKSFQNITNDNYRLWICGDGDSKEIVINYSKNDIRIKYFGQITRNEVITLQKRATVLINPRFSSSEFTKYSFASKTIEYLASGTPLIMHPLKCLTEDYLKHIYIANDESHDGLTNKIIEICEKDQDELNNFGELARKFIIDYKNSYVQVGKILKLLNDEK